MDFLFQIGDSRTKLQFPAKEKNLIQRTAMESRRYGEIRGSTVKIYFLPPVNLSGDMRICVSVANNFVEDFGQV